MASTPPPGWYSDPVGTGLQRYFDGQRWTVHVTHKEWDAPLPSENRRRGLFEHSGLQFHRVGLGFWGSLVDWIREITLCWVFNHHDWDDWPACRRCGTSGRGPS